MFEPDSDPKRITVHGENFLISTRIRRDGVEFQQTAGVDGDPEAAFQCSLTYFVRGTSICRAWLAVMAVSGEFPTSAVQEAR